jgi:hypothetical protein
VKGVGRNFPRTRRRHRAHHNTGAGGTRTGGGQQTGRPQCDSVGYMAVDVGGGSRGERISKLGIYRSQRHLELGEERDWGTGRP